MTERAANEHPSPDATKPAERTSPDDTLPDQRVDPDAPGATLINEDQDAVEPNEPG